MVQVLQKQNVDVTNIVQGVLKVITDTKKLKNEMSAQIIAVKGQFLELSTYFETLMYKQVKYKFRWAYDLQKKRTKTIAEGCFPADISWQSCASS